jgi:hypothetical protein
VVIENNHIYNKGYSRLYPHTGTHNMIIRNNTGHDQVFGIIHLSDTRTEEHHTRTIP